MKKLLILLVLFLLVPMSLVAAQDEPYSLAVRRDFGYGNGADIQGRMTLSVRGDEDRVAAVTYLIDGQEMARVTAAPFRHSFDTGQFTAGTHELRAVVETTDGESIETRSLIYRFVTSREVTSGMTRILIPVGIIVLLSFVVPILLQTRAAKQRTLHPGEPIDYGAAGGAICPKCGNPFPRSLLSPHIGALKVERCPSCGKISLVGRASLPELRAAEAEQARKYGVEAPLSTVTEAGGMEAADLDDTRYSGDV